MHINSIYVPEQQINNINIIRGQDILAEIKNKLHIRLLEIFFKKTKILFFPNKLFASFTGTFTR